jgi:hypothetical protein
MQNYSEIVKHLAAAFDATRRVGLRDFFSKGGVGEILLAHNRGHDLEPTDKGADGISATGERFEYKVSITDQYNFHFGTREEDDLPQDKIQRHFKKLTGAICAARDGESITRIVYIPKDSLVKDLIAHFAKPKGKSGKLSKQLNKNFTFKRLLRLPGALELPATPANPSGPAESQ